MSNDDLLLKRSNEDPRRILALYCRPRIILPPARHALMQSSNAAYFSRDYVRKYVRYKERELTRVYNYYNPASLITHGIARQSFDFRSGIRKVSEFIQV